MQVYANANWCFPLGKKRNWKEGIDEGVLRIFQSVENDLSLQIAALNGNLSKFSSNSPVLSENTKSSRLKQVCKSQFHCSSKRKMQSRHFVSRWQYRHIRTSLHRTIPCSLSMVFERARLIREKATVSFVHRETHFVRVMLSSVSLQTETTKKEIAQLHSNRPTSP